MPKNADEILRLVDDANRLHEEKVKLEALVNGMMADGGKAKAKLSKTTTKTSSSSASKSNPWASAMSVAAVQEASAKNLLPKLPPIIDSDDSDDDEPLKFKNQTNGHAKKKQKKDKEPKEKKFKGVTAYNVFVGKESTRLRELCKEEGRPITTAEDKKELMSKVGALWKELTEEQKVPWQKLADERNIVKRAEFDGKAADDDALSGGE
tara:strand:- start:392 stop:1015 length:624 start_codon:yes stop_codon:yes gene_type:complete